MQIEVSATRVIDMLASKLGKKEAEIARLEATNEVLMERLREYVERDRVTKLPQVSQDIDDAQPTDT